MSGLEAVDFPRTHNIRILMALVPSDVRPGLAVDLQDRLTEYATLTRYPGDYEPIQLTEAQDAVRIARRVRREVRRVLPSAALRRASGSGRTRRRAEGGQPPASTP